MTRRTLIYLGIGVVLVGLLVFRLIFKQKKKFDRFSEEREWYAKNLNYDFSAVVDTVALDHPGQNYSQGMVVCKVTRGDINCHTEDSLKRKLEHHKRLRFNEMKRPGYVRFVMPAANRFVTGDSLVVNSDSNRLEFYREQKRFYHAALSELLTAKMDVNFD
jgi:hypothetical protein